MPEKKDQSYKLLGIDPGTNILGFAVIEVRNGKQLIMLELGVVKMAHLKEQALKLEHLFKRVSSIIEVHQPQEMAIEAPFFGKNVQSMLKLGRAQGVAIAAALSKGIGFTEYSPKKIKQSITGNGNASKEQVAAMLENIISFKPEDHFLDATDALATAICHYYQSQNPLGNSKKYGSWKAFLKENPNRKGG